MRRRFAENFSAATHTQIDSSLWSADQYGAASVLKWFGTHINCLQKFRVAHAQRASIHQALEVCAPRVADAQHILPALSIQMFAAFLTTSLTTGMACRNNGVLVRHNIR